MFYVYYMYSIWLDFLAAERVAEHANNWTSRGKQTLSSYFGDTSTKKPQTKRKRPRTTYFIGEVCRNTFQFLMG